MLTDKPSAQMALLCRSGKQRALPLSAVLALCLVLLGVRFASAQSEVTIGYQLIYNPWKVAIANGDIERSVDRPVSWRKFESGAKVVNTMILGKVQMPRVQHRIALGKPLRCQPVQALAVAAQQRGQHAFAH